jgi:hypothetical protein
MCSPCLLAASAPFRRTRVTEEIDQLRRMVNRRVAESSLRQAAREIRMSASGLNKFMDGGAPYQKTIHKLRGWRARLNVASNTPVQAEDADSALRLLATGLEPGPQSQAVLEALDAFGRAYGDEPPAWLPEVREWWESRSSEVQDRDPAG